MGASGGFAAPTPWLSASPLRSVRGGAVVLVHFSYLSIGNVIIYYVCHVFCWKRLVI